MAKKTLTINEKFVQDYVAKNGYPEAGTFDQDQLKKFYKHLSTDQLQDWIELEGLEFKPAESAPINRMRMCMAVLYSRFPKAPAAKKKSKYADYSLEQLLNLAIENEVAFEDTDDERILRMRAIVALRVAKIIE